MIPVKTVQAVCSYGKPLQRGLASTTILITHEIVDKVVILR